MSPKKSIITPIKGFVDLSFVDWDGKVSSVIFLPNCNFRCPFCYNSTLVLHPERMETIAFEQVENYLKRQRFWIDGVCITGGEPTIHDDLPDLCSELKKMGFEVKIDTNGTNPMMIKELMNKEFVDYIAVDIKAPLTSKKYSKVTNVNAEKHLQRLKETIKILLKSDIDYEFRTTVVPTLHEENDIAEICNWIKGCKKYVLQRLDTRLGRETINPKFSSLKTFTDERMKTFMNIANRFISNVKLR